MTKTFRSLESKENIWKVIGASSAGTLIEWYDFYIFGSLALIIAEHFFPAGSDGNSTIALLSTLATFATGFIVRPFGAVIFGRMGDLLGRKHTFLVTLVLMGAATFTIGLLPTYKEIGILAPLGLLVLRLVQGLALGGEYGGAATYVAEHSPKNQRGFYTSFIQTTATLGLFISLGVILATRTLLGESDFKMWGWRIPFLLSVVLIGLSYLLRRKLHESPVFARLKASGKTSQTPIRDSFGNPENRKIVLIALFGATAGQGVIWYTGQFYALYYLQTVLKINAITANQIIALALVLGTPFFIVAGWLSDKIGRKPIMMTGHLLAIVFYFPIYKGMMTLSGYNAANPAMPLHEPRFFALTLLVLAQVFFVTLVYGPIAAFLVELFPAKIRYTSMSLPYHIGNGVFGGLVPLIGTAAVAATGNPFAGLFYPIAIAGLTFLTAALFLREPKKSTALDPLPEEAPSEIAIG